ncbi:hypothetical protein MYXO_00979 [Myxococcaceae bacterium]|nr:hypothetical protein MYXO_00979 [Myxococcaceae bacterium]
MPFLGVGGQWEGGMLLAVQQLASALSPRQHSGNGRFRRMPGNAGNARPSLRSDGLIPAYKVRKESSGKREPAFRDQFV